MFTEAYLGTHRALDRLSLVGDGPLLIIGDC